MKFYNADENKNVVLIADDSELNREMLSEILGDEYEYVYAENGDETLEILSGNNHIDILLLDMNMPGTNGMTVLKVMREHNWTEEIPVVIISAEDDMNFIRNAYYLGASDYIVRPFNAFLVQHRVKNTLMMYMQKKQLVRMVEKQVFKREKINNMLIRIFSHVVGVVNNESGSHTLNVQIITNLILKRLCKKTDRYKLSDADVSMISLVSALHDIGKIMIPDEILNKPGKLTDYEWKIMKLHTVKGDEFLKNIPIDQDDEMMRAARDICMYHHERYDGSGYPEGLKGDEIPIAAQVVSIADVYDALTSERCYKSSYSHHEAVEMILGGECGIFNPLLLECFEEVSDELVLNLSLNSFDAVKSSNSIADEFWANESPSVDERLSGFSKTEKFKKEFFAERCRGIQFEYDAILKRVLYINYYNKYGEKILLKENVTQLLNENDWELLKQKVSETTRENPYVSMNVLVPINDDCRWHNLTIATVWNSSSHSYVGIVGQFTDIHKRIVEYQKKLLVDGFPITGETILEMRDVFDFVRVVDTDTCSVIKTDEDGEIVYTGQKCFSVWNRTAPCKNCTSRNALADDTWHSKAEIKNGMIYSVNSRRVKYGEKDCVLEVAYAIGDSSADGHNDIGFYPDSDAIKNFYKDPLTKTYTRAYIEKFMPNLENSKGVAIADVDEFKRINDTFGHLAGDAALKHISKLIKSTVRKEDVVIRYGGDEFLLLFNDISEDDFRKKLQSIKETVNSSVSEEYPNIKHAISIGGAYDIHPFEKAIDVADKAMYRDKFSNKH